MTSEIQMHLNSSDLWNQRTVNRDDKQLTQVRHKEKEYIGRLLPEPRVALPELREQRQQVLDSLQQFCPDLDIEALKIVILPQVFLS